MRPVLHGPVWASIVGVSGLAVLAVLHVVWNRRSNPGSRLFALVLGLAIVYTFGYAAQVLALTLPGKLLWVKVQYLALSVLPVAAFLFALDYTGRSGRITPRVVSGLLVLPVVSVVVILFVPDHGLYFVDTHLVYVGGHPDLEYAHGPLGQLFWLYQYVLYSVSVLLFFALGVRSRAYRAQASLLCVAFLFPLLVEAVAVLSPSIVVDPVPLAFLLTAVLVTWGVYRSQFLDVVPVDRDRILERIRGAVFVLDTRDRIVDVNRAGEDLLGVNDPIGDDADALFDAAGFERPATGLEDGAMVARTDGGEYRYEVGREEIETWNGDRRGVVLTLHDVTERWEAERRLHASNEQLAVLGRLLRHDIRNDAAVILGWSQPLADGLDDERAAMLDRIRTSAEHVVELTESARGLAESFVDGADVDLSPVALDGVLADAVAAARSRYPDATFHEPPSYPSVSVPANELLSSVFENLLNNAVQHNDGDPEVTVSVTRLDGAVRVVIADDGPGIPGAISERLFERGLKGETSSGTGLGLYLVRHLVESYGGSITAYDNEPRGTRMLVRLPTVDGSNPRADRSPSAERAAERSDPAPPDVDATDVGRPSDEGARTNAPSEASDRRS